jgi:hypothetical protein
MNKGSVKAIISALNDHQVQYLIVGGLAVVAHGYLRFTADVDLVLAVDPQNLTRAVAALKLLGYRPRVPVPIEQFMDPAIRRQWAADKNMMVFSLVSPQHQRTEIDLFLEPPFDFAGALARSVRYEVEPGIAGVFCGIDDLIDLKSKAGRPIDVQDVEHLRQLQPKEGP